LDPPGADVADLPDLRRYQRFARLWLLVQFVVTLALVYSGWALIALVLFGVGYIGFAFVFDRKRSWWRQEVRDHAPAKQPLRTRLVSVWPLVLVTLIVVVIWLALER